MKVLQAVPSYAADPQPARVDTHCPRGHGAAMEQAMERVSGTCVEVEGFGVLLRGCSGAGKSDLALRLINDGARLVADDYAEVVDGGAHPIARAPAAIAGLLEVRGVGVLRMAAAASAALVACVDLVAPDQVVRTPSAETTAVGTGRWQLPLFRLTPFEASAVAKVRLAVRLCTGGVTKVA